MKINFVFLGLFLFVSSSYSSALPGNLISCRPKSTIADAGKFVDVSQTGSNVIYTFSHDSYSGRQIYRQRPVTIGSLKTNHSCKLTIYTSDDYAAPRPMLYISKDSSSNDWMLQGVGNESAPDLKCDVSAELENEKCSSSEE